MTIFDVLANPRKCGVHLASAAASIIPVVPVAIAWCPEFRISGIPATNIVFAMVLYLLLAEFGRRRGLDMERSLEERWEGSQAVALLRHHDSTIPQAQKRRYRAALQSLIPGWTSPSAEQETGDPGTANAVYGEAVLWLIRKSSDANRLPLLDRYLGRYRFRLNMLGLRPWLIVSGTATVILGISGMGSHDHSALLGNATALSALLTIVIPILTSREVDIRKAATEYAECLLEAHAGFENETSRSPGSR